MLCTEKEFMVQAHNCSEWSELRDSTLVIPLFRVGSMIEGTTSVEPITL